MRSIPRLLAQTILGALCIAAQNAMADEFGWKSPVSGAFNDNANWNHFPNPGHPTGSDGAIFAVGGPYTVTCDGASSGVTSIGDDVTFQLDGDYTVGEFHLGAAAITLRGGGTLRGGPFTVTGSILVDGAGLSMNGVNFSAVPGPTHLTGINGAQIKTSGLVEGFHKPLLESGAEWHHAGALNAAWYLINSGALLAADEITATPADLDGGRLQTGHLIASGVRAKNGATLRTDTVTLSGVTDTVLDGSNTHWLVSGPFDATNASVDVQTGAGLSVGNLTGTGFYTIDGSGSQLAVASSITGGTVTVRNQGQASAASLSGTTLIARDPDSHFVFAGLATDTGVLISNGGRIAGGGMSGPTSIALENTSLSIKDAGSALLLNTSLEVGRAGQGTLQISNGGEVRCGLGLLNGGRAGGNSSGSVSGSGSYWLARDGLIVGDDLGKAQLDLSSGARVEVRGKAVALGLQPGGDGTLTVDGGSAADPSAFDARQSPEVGVGVEGKGLLTVRNQGRFLSGDLTVGADSGSDGRLEVVGAGSSVEVGGKFTVGKSGTGETTIIAGGTATAQDVSVGSNAGTNLLHLTRAGSKLTIAKSFFIGDTGAGQLLIEQGAQVLMTGSLEAGCALGRQPGSSGVVTVDGSGSALLGAQGVLSIGTFGPGTLAIQNGAEVNFEIIVLSLDASAFGRATIAGAGSVMRASKRVGIGGATNSFGPGDVTVSDGGLLQSGFTLNIFKKGVLRLSGGAAIVGQTSEAALPNTILVGNQGILRLGGQLNGSIRVQQGGTFLPGASPGHAAVFGDLTLEAGTALELEMAGSEAGISYDQIEASGTVALGGNLDFVFRDGFAPTNGQVFELVRGATVTTNFSVVNVKGLAPGFTYNLDLDDGNTLRLTATSSAVATTTPELSVKHADNGNVDISWPEYVTGWILQQTTDLHLPDWQPIVAPGNHLSIVPAAASGFFRLASGR